MMILMTMITTISILILILIHPRCSWPWWKVKKLFCCHVPKRGEEEKISIIIFTTFQNNSDDRIRLSVNSEPKNGSYMGDGSGHINTAVEVTNNLEIDFYRVLSTPPPPGVLGGVARLWFFRRGDYDWWNRYLGVVNEYQRLSTTNRFSNKISHSVRLQGHYVEIRKHSLYK